mgnify:CR=1 FL=1
MGACLQPCPHHEAIDRDVTRHQEWIGDLQEELRRHCANGGKGHVSRFEFDLAKESIKEVAAAVKAVADAVTTMQTQEQIERAGLTRKEKMALSLWGVLGPVLAVIISVVWGACK